MLEQLQQLIYKKDKELQELHKQIKDLEEEFQLLLEIYKELGDE